MELARGGICGLPMPEEWFPTVADDLFARATRHRQTLPPDVQAFVDAHRSRPPG